MSRLSHLKTVIANQLRSSTPELANALAQVVLQAVQDELRSILLLDDDPSKAPAAQRIRNCVAPGCTNASRGPRFGYCCRDHESAPKAQKAKWRKEYLAREKQSATQSATLAYQSKTRSSKQPSAEAAPAKKRARTSKVKSKTSRSNRKLPVQTRA